MVGEDVIVLHLFFFKHEYFLPELTLTVDNAREVVLGLVGWLEDDLTLLDQDVVRRDVVYEH